MEDKLYYEAYEDRYRKAYAAGAVRWGHGPEDEALRAMLKRWVDTFTGWPANTSSSSPAARARPA